MIYLETIEYYLYMEEQEYIQEEETKAEQMGRKPPIVL